MREIGVLEFVDNDLFSNVEVCFDFCVLVWFQGELTLCSFDCDRRLLSNCPSRRPSSLLCPRPETQTAISSLTNLRESLNVAELLSQREDKVRR